MGYPQDWHTNTAGTLDECQVFDPAPVELPEGAQQLPLDLAVTIRVEDVAFDRVVADDRGADVTAEEDVEVGGAPAVRQEVVATGDALHPPGTTSTRYVVDRDGTTLLAVAYDVGEPAYERKVEVLDEMMATLTFD